MSSALMYGAEVTWRGQNGVEGGVQRTVNRISKTAFLPSTLVAFLEAEGAVRRKPPG